MGGFRALLLVLSGFWLAWRHRFSPAGLGLGVLGLLGGIPVLTTYLLIASFRVRGDVAALLLGPGRVPGSAQSLPPR